MSEAPLGANKRVMVVDDDRANLLLASEVLRLYGVEPVGWTNGEQALLDFKRRAFGLVFMDVHMPGLSGLEATDCMRAFEKLSGRERTPIVALTASAMPRELSECMKHDMDAVLAKPFAFDSLQKMLVRWSIIDPGP